MRNTNIEDLKSITITAEFKDGTQVRVENPKALLMAFQNVDIGVPDSTKDFEDEVKKIQEANKEVGGVQIVGTGENLKFALFTLLRQLVDTLGSHDVIDVFNRTMMYIGDNARIEHQLHEASKQKNKILN